MIPLGWHLSTNPDYYAYFRWRNVSNPDPANPYVDIYFFTAEDLASYLSGVIAGTMV